jgi:hypothetical protein
MYAGGSQRDDAFPHVHEKTPTNGRVLHSHQGAQELWERAVLTRIIRPRLPIKRARATIRCGIVRLKRLCALELLLPPAGGMLEDDYVLSLFATYFAQSNFVRKIMAFDPDAYPPVVPAQTFRRLGRTGYSLSFF